MDILIKIFIGIFAIMTIVCIEFSEKYRKKKQYAKVDFFQDLSYIFCTAFIFLVFISLI